MEIRSHQPGEPSDELVPSPGRAEARTCAKTADSPGDSPGDSPTGSPTEAERRRWDTLLSLLDDDSPVVLAGVRSEFRRAGRAGRPALVRALDSGSARIRARARQLLVDHERQRVLRRLVRRAAGKVDLESSLFLLDNYSSPRLDARPYRKALDAMAEKVRAEASTRTPGVQRAHAVVDVLAGEMGFQGATEDFHHPDNIFLWRTIERRRGMPLTLCAIYAFVARRAGLTAGLLPFPGHVLVRLAHAPGKKGEIVDPFGGGQVLSEGQCLSYLSEHRLPYQAEWFRPAPDEAMFERHLRNLARSCRVRGRITESREIGTVVSALAARRNA